MKKATVELIEKRFKNDFDEISYRIRDNASRISALAKEQRELKETRRGLFSILQIIRK